MDITYKLIRSGRRTLAVEISRDGQIIARAPSLMPRNEIDSFIMSKADWIRKHQKIAAIRQVKQAKKPPLNFQEIQDLADKAMTDIPERVRRFAPLVGVSFGKITIRNQKTRWGSCSAKGNLNFNCLLMLAPPEVRDYVVVHELCHRLEMNHSNRFWAQVERILPDYRIRLNWLKEHGGEIMARMTG